jgi:hypothetical protein
MSTSSDYASLRRGARSKTHFATASLWQPGLLLPVMMAILDISILS